MKTWRRNLHIIAPLSVGAIAVIASISVWYLTVASERRAVELEFVGRANNQLVILESRIRDYWDRLYAVRALFDSSKDEVTREEFESFSNSLLDGHPAILNIAWIPRIRREDRVAHELAASRDGLPNYHIRIVAPDGSLPVSPERDEYFPKFYSTEGRTSPVYGLDLNDGGPRMRTVAGIRDGSLLSISPPLTLHIGQGDRRGFWAGVPVYARDLPHETLEDRRRNLLGIVQGVFQIGVMFDTILSGVKTPVRIYLFAPDASKDDLPLYFSSRLGTRSIEARSQAELAGGLHRSFPFNFGDVRWTLVVAPEFAGLVFAGHETSSIVLISGLLLSAGLTAFMWAMRRYAHNVEIANGKFEKQNVRFDAALNNMALGLLMFDSAGKLVISNRRFAVLMGMPWEKWERAALGRTIPQAMQLVNDLTNVGATNQARVMTELQSILSSRTAGTIIVERTDGRTAAASCAPMTDGGFVVTFEDITERRRTERKISHMAHHDALTDLSNRVSFYEAMAKLLARTSQGGSFAVLSLDLDRFKNVNDTLGHPMGDKLLQAVAGRMCRCVREDDVVARLGGDEFAIIQVNVEAVADAISLASRLIDALSAPYHLDGHQVVVGTSVGIAIAPGDGVVPDQLMKRADLALYRSKAEGGSMYRFYDAQIDDRKSLADTSARPASFGGQAKAVA